ncbi:uncharacterized protein LOC125246975 [Megalobrama amblycephala]|uniref:uncharacterized protein LOC125246975 n=1 Tax=Megalobrama amblycephala TaxID=75352 RepID=UPI002013FD9D|nr:uncharacterized protein LOC125246975 [Megalobrama amblycephala]
MESVALMADVESMFYQVKVPAADSDLLRFLWWSKGDLSKDLEEFRMVVHLFGASSSPSCSNYALRRCAEDHGDVFNCITAEVIRKHFFVDDCLTSVPTESDVIQLYKELHAMCAKGEFHLTKWMSNSRGVLNVIPEEERVKEVKDLDLNHDVLPMERVLGLQWCAESDTFRFKVVIKDRPLTRRGILSVISAIYDPLPFLSPVVLSAKMILQDLCRERIGWDSVIPIKYVQRWRNWLEDLYGLDKCETKICLKPVEFGEVTLAQLHHFSASEEGYGVVSYLLLHNSQSIVHLAFLMGKARVAPVKSIIITRIELTAATLASRMDRLWKSDLRMKLQDSVFWLDSTAVLKYIQNESSRFKCFVANRVSEILRASSEAQWRYIGSANNPADFASGGLKEQMWTFGPPFLTRSQEEWPNNPINLEKSFVQDAEIKQEVVVNTLLVQTEEGGFVTVYSTTWSSIGVAFR